VLYKRILKDRLVTKKMYLIVKNSLYLLKIFSCMSKVKFLFLPLLFISSFCFSQHYIQLEKTTTCEEASMLSIYATSDDVRQLDSLMNQCDQLEYIRIKGFIEGPHWVKLFSILEHCVRLKGIELFYNDGLKKLPKTIKQNKQLRVISVVGNRQLDYDDLFKKLSGLDSLQKISLVDNKLREIPHSFKKIKGLKQLHISGNEGLDYKSLVASLKETDIEELSIPLNSLSDIPAEIKELSELKVLDIRKNFISELPDDIKSLKKLETFKSEENIFLNVNEELSKLKGLNIKYLSFDDVKDDELNEIQSVFPNAIIKKKEMEGGMEDNIKELAPSIEGKDFSVVQLEGGECDLAIKQYNGLFLGKNNYTNIDSLGFYERLNSVKYSYNEKVLADGRYEGVPLMLHRKWMLKSTNVHYPRYKIKKGEIAFSICPDGNLYPELKAFNGMLWVYVGDKNKKDFNKAYVQKRNWKDVFLEFDAVNETFFVVLKGDFTEKIPAYPRYVNPQSSLKHAKLQYAKKFQMYEKRLDLRSHRFNKEIERQKIKNELRKQKIANKNWSRLRSYMCDFEKSFNRKGWLDYREFHINKNHIPLDTLEFNLLNLKESCKVRYINYKKSEVSSSKNIINPVIGKFLLNFKQSSGNEFPTKVLVYYPTVRKLTVFNGEFGSGIEVRPNLDFVIILIKEGALCFYTGKEFMKEVRSGFSEKSPIDVVVSKSFKNYDLKSFWKVMNHFD